MIISIDSEDIVRATRVARMVAKCDCEEKGGNVENHFATIICNNHDQLLEERDRLRNGLHQLLDGIEDSACHVSGVISLQYEIDLIKQLLNGETK